MIRLSGAGTDVAARGTAVKSRYHSSYLRAPQFTPMPEELYSKTVRKKQMHDLQDLGTELVALSAEQLDALDLPERLRDAVGEARRITKHEARRRQMQYIGKLMRHVDADPIRDRISALKSVSHAETARLHLIERWRERLLAEPDALTELLAEHPDADSRTLRTLIRGAAEEKAADRPPRCYRQLFQVLREVLARGREESGARSEE